jgi:pimeloyl-ACP methyl ester carboxylesterase
MHSAALGGIMVTAEWVPRRSKRVEQAMPQAHVNDVNLHYETVGDSGYPLVLVHGSWSDHHSWDRVVPLLARSFRVLTYDRRGHSQSERPPGQGSVHEDVTDLGTLIEHLGFAPAHFAGSSFGGSIVLGLACRRPELFRTLMAHEPPLFSLLADEPETRPALEELEVRKQAVVERLRHTDMAGGARLFVETVSYGPGAWEQLPPQLRETFIANAPTFLDETSDPDVTSIDLSALSQFNRPALLTHGGSSEPFFPPVVSKLATAIEGAKVIAFTEAGHTPHLSQPDRYAAVITAFVEGREVEVGNGS